MTLREVLCVDEMEDLKWVVTGDRSGQDYGMERTHGGAKERLDMWNPREWITMHGSIRNVGRCCTD